MRRSCAKNSCQEWVQHCLWHTGWLRRRRPMPPAATCLQPKIFGQEMIRQPIPQPIKEQPKKKPHSKLLGLGRWWWWFFFGQIRVISGQRLFSLTLYSQTKIFIMISIFMRYSSWYDDNLNIFVREQITLLLLASKISDNTKKNWEMEIWFFFSSGGGMTILKKQKILLSCSHKSNLSQIFFAIP